MFHFCKRSRSLSLISSKVKIPLPWTGTFLFSTSSPSSVEEAESRVETNIDTKTGICNVILNRPTKLNAVDMKMFEAVAETASKIRENKSIRVVILSGKGRAFCTGLDVKSVMKNPLKMTSRLLERPSGYGVVGNEIGNLAQDVGYLWRELPIPVIGVLHGMCYGAGVQIALGADIRYSTPDCKLSIMEGKWGLIPDMSASITLKELVRIDIAKELTMTGRIISGTEASDIGLVTKVCDDPHSEAEKLALELVGRSPDAIAYCKELYHKTWTNPSEKECLEIETDLQKKLLASWNQLASSGRSLSGYEIPYSKRKD